MNFASCCCCLLSFTSGLKFTRSLKCFVCWELLADPYLHKSVTGVFQQGQKFRSFQHTCKESKIYAVLIWRTWSMVHMLKQQNSFLLWHEAIHILLQSTGCSKHPYNSDKTKPFDTSCGYNEHLNKHWLGTKSKQREWWMVGREGEKESAGFPWDCPQSLTGMCS